MDAQPIPFRQTPYFPLFLALSSGLLGMLLQVHVLWLGAIITTICALLGFFKGLPYIEVAPEEFFDKIASLVVPCCIYWEAAIFGFKYIMPEAHAGWLLLPIAYGGTLVVVSAIRSDIY